MEVHLTIALVALAAQGCQGRGSLGSAANDGGGFDAAGPGSGGAAGQVVGGAPGSGGSGGREAGGTGGAGGVSVPAPDVRGRWAMFAFEDPVAVVLDETNSVIGGTGCCGGLGDLPGLCCGAVTGQVVGRRASFWFPINGLGHYVYATEVFVSADGQRMAGTFKVDTNNSLPVSWVRIGPSEPWLPSADRAVSGVMTALVAGYALNLSDNPAGGSDFSAQQTYRLSVLNRFVTGDLGAYWDREISWRADEQTLVVGPVPETAPGLPIALWLRFDGSTLTSVEAAMASGLHYRFNATASQR